MRSRGSVTVFLALILTCVFGGMFAFLEAARVCALRANAQLCTEQAADGLLASYNRPLWETYRLTFWEGAEGDFPQLSGAGQLQREIVEGNWLAYGFGDQNYYVLPVHLTDVAVTDYQLATDHGGDAFIRNAAEAMKRSAAKETVSLFVDWISGTDCGQDEEQAAKQEQAAADALKELRRAEQTEPAASGQQDAQGTKQAVSGGQERTLSGTQGTDPPSAGGQTSPGSVGQTASENPLEWMEKVKKNGALAIVMPGKAVSDKKIDLSDSVGTRELQEGTLPEAEKRTISDKALFRLYLSTFFSNAASESADRALSYETEYLIAGRRSDKANLTAVVNRLLLIREAANMVYLRSDMQKQQEALALAAAISSVAAHPEMTEQVKTGVLIAWAFAESVSDVRILLAGGNVSLIKTEDQWHTQLNRLASSVTETDGEQQKKGLPYEGYLQILLWTGADKKLAQRAMTLIEENTGVRMDRMLSRMDCTYRFQAGSLFWNFVSLTDREISGFCFEEEKTLSYGAAEEP